MSWLLFDRDGDRVSLYEGTPPPIPHQFVGPPVGSWPAHNDTASTSRGKWSTGIYDWTHYNEHEDLGFAPGCFKTSYGCDGIHVFKVKGRDGMGVHAGRTFGQSGKTGGKTLGCIRVPADAMQSINRLHKTDRLLKIEVR